MRRLLTMAGLVAASSLLVAALVAALLASTPARADGPAQPAAWKLSLRPARDAAVFDVAQDPHVTATVRNIAGHTADATLTFSVADLDGRQLNSGSEHLTVARGTSDSADLLLGKASALPHGEYLALDVVLTAGGKTQAEEHQGFGFLPQRKITSPPDSSPFGLLSESSWPLLQRLGVRHVRPNWTWAERPMDWAKRHGIAYCALVNEANAFANGDMTAKQYADFVGESVRRYKRYVKYWQLGNEFDIFHTAGPKAYVEAQRIGYEAAKAADPHCIVIGGSITALQVRRAGWAESLADGLAKYCDVYDFHFYQDLKTTQDLLDYIHATCKQYHAVKPIWVTETTEFPMADPDDRNQASYVFKRYAQLLSDGVSVVFWHCFRWPYPYSVDKVQATALVDYQGFARPGLFAYAAMTRDLAGAKFRRRWSVGDGVYAIEFARGARSSLVLWSEGDPVRVEGAVGPAEAGGKVWVTRISGRREPVAAATAGLPDLRLLAGKTPCIYDLPAHITRLRRG